MWPGTAATGVEDVEDVGDVEDVEDVGDVVDVEDVGLEGNDWRIGRPKGAADFKTTFAALTLWNTEFALSAFSTFLSGCTALDNSRY